MTDNKATEHAKQQLAKNREQQAKARDFIPPTDVDKSKPTPTQEENDLAALGANVVEKEPDGSQEQPPAYEAVAPSSSHTTRHVEARQGTGGASRGAYETRQSQAKPSASS